MVELNHSNLAPGLPRLRVITSGRWYYIEAVSGASGLTLPRSRRLETPEALVWDGAVSRPIELWADGERRVVWDPVALNGLVRRLGAGGPPAGRGYAEKLTMTMAPWRLGLSRLWWGRFCGERRSLVWICWEGARPLRLALVDGKRSSLDAVSEELIAAGPAFRLDIMERRLLVDEAIGAWAAPLARASWLKRVAPLAFLAGRERKWLARGALSEAGQPVDAGNVICEVVEWG